MSDVEQLAMSFTDTCSSDVCVSAPSYTLSVIAENLKFPVNYTELSADDVEYISGEWSLFGWNPQTSDVIGRYYNGDTAGKEWLAARSLAYFGAATWGGLMTTVGSILTGPVIGACVAVVGYGYSVYLGAVGCSLFTAYGDACTFCGAGQSYEVRENKWCGIINGYEANRI